MERKVAAILHADVQGFTRLSPGVLPDGAV
jgi:class 3 adenylate cyclase